MLSSAPALCQPDRGTSCRHVSAIPGHVGTIFGHVGSILMPDKLPWWCRARRRLQRPCESLWTTTTTLCWSIAYTARTGPASLSCSSCCSAVWSQRYHPQTHCMRLRTHCMRTHCTTRLTGCALTPATPYPVDMLEPRHDKLHPAPPSVCCLCTCLLCGPAHIVCLPYSHANTSLPHTSMSMLTLDRRLGKSFRLCAFADSCAGLRAVRDPLEEL